jgi:multimeric flavodoxin WrbA
MEAGNEVDVERVVTDVVKNIKLKNLPIIEGYDGLIFGTLVHAFSLSPVMKDYLEHIPSLQDKKIACFVTKGVTLQMDRWNPRNWTDEKYLQIQGGTVIETGIVI